MGKITVSVNTEEVNGSPNYGTAIAALEIPVKETIDPDLLSLYASFVLKEAAAQAANLLRFNARAEVRDALVRILGQLEAAKADLTPNPNPPETNEPGTADRVALVGFDNDSEPTPLPERAPERSATDEWTDEDSAKAERARDG